MVFEAIKKVLDDEKAIGQELNGPSSLSHLVLELSTRTSETATFDSFCHELTTTISTSLTSVGKVRSQLARERAFGTFHQLRSLKLPDIWKRLSHELKLPPINSLQQQAVNFQLFKKLLLEAFALVTAVPGAMTQRRVNLSSEEDNAIRYASGFITAKLLKKYEDMKGEKAAQFVECLSNMGSSGDDASFYRYTREWITNIDRGGLLHISDNTFCFFKAVEIKTQECLPDHLRSQSSEKSKDSLLKAVIGDEDVQCYWHMLALYITRDEDVAELLHTIVDLWITMRGFALTSSWLEQYKLANKKNVKKSKTLRKGLQDGSSK